MTSGPKVKSHDCPDKKRPDDIVENKNNPNCWDGTIKTLKLSLMKTGIFGAEKVQDALQEMEDQDTSDARIDSSEEPDISVTDAGFNPYDSSWKK